MKIVIPNAYATDTVNLNKNEKENRVWDTLFYFKNLVCTYLHYKKRGTQFICRYA